VNCAAGDRVSVIVPAHNAAPVLAACLEAIRNSQIVPIEVVVVDDASSDGTGAVAAQFGVAALRIEGKPRGPAAARNLGARNARGDVLVFIDSDVVIHPTAIDRLLAPLRGDPGTVAAFGSYDDRPPSRRTAALYGNLRHHHVHQHSRPAARTFWAGCGAVRRSAFLTAGGFDESYRQPSIEDVELGLRLTAAGHRIRLVPEAQGTHLKVWTVLSLWRSDIFRRAVPWSHLLARHGGISDDLNTTVAERIAAIAAHLVWIGIALALFLPVAGLAVALAFLVLWVVLQGDFLKLLWRRGGWRALLGGGLLHYSYFLYASMVLVVVTSLRVCQGWRGAPAKER
jgi:glycosyltransferase involved in cell wall biosynthesis